MATSIHFGPGLDAASQALLGALVVATLRESPFGLRLGCRICAVLMRVGLVPAEIRPARADSWSPEAVARRQAIWSDMAVAD